MMNVDPQSCPVCLTKCERAAAPLKFGEGKFKLIKCPRCGDYTATNYIYETWGIPPEYKSNRASISAALREKFEMGENIALSYDKLPESVPDVYTVGELLSLYKEPNIQQKLEKIITFLKKRSAEFGHNIAVKDDDLAVAGAKSSIEFNHLLEELENQGFIKKRKISQGHYVNLTYSGFMEATKNTIPENSLRKLGEQLHQKIILLNRLSSVTTGRDFIEFTTDNSAFFAHFPEDIRNKIEIRSFVEDLYKLMYEGSGSLVRVPQSFKEDWIFIKHLRTSWSHDIDQGDENKAVEKKRIIGNIFKQFSGKSSPELMNDNDFVSMAKNLVLHFIELLEQVIKSLQ